MFTVDDYLALITSQHADKTKFRETVALSVSLFSRMQEVLEGMPQRFDVTDDGPQGSDTDQLDKLGEWIGRSRFVYIPVEAEVPPFTWDDTPASGWDTGGWDFGEVEVVGGAVTRLNNSLFRKMLLGKIAANNWKGTRDGQYGILLAAFGADGSVRIVDNQDMTQTVLVNVAALSALELALLRLQYIPIKSAGVGLNFEQFFLPSFDASIFRGGTVLEGGTLIWEGAILERVLFGASDFLRFYSEEPHTVETVYTFTRNGVDFATATVAAGGTFANGVLLDGESLEFLAGDVLGWYGGGDATGADLEASFYGARVPVEE